MSSYIKLKPIMEYENLPVNDVVDIIGIDIMLVILKKGNIQETL